jgi:serine/threonine protein kinase
VSYLHREINGEATAHHDLKLINILFLETDQIFKICDFGTSKLYREDEGSATSGIIDTLEYLAPEYYDY